MSEKICEHCYGSKTLTFVGDYVSPTKTIQCPFCSTKKAVKKAKSISAKKFFKGVPGGF